MRSDKLFDVIEVVALPDGVVVVTVWQFFPDHSLGSAQSEELLHMRWAVHHTLVFDRRSTISGEETRSGALRIAPTRASFRGTVQPCIVELTWYHVCKAFDMHMLPNLASVIVEPSRDEPQSA